MQSQQKRVKWSRGETAEALEERTDTGITQASVELMENCIPDIYGNISRRPALKPIPYANTYVPITLSRRAKFGFLAADLVKVVPFYITENDYILIGVYAYNGNYISFIRIKNGECVSAKITNATGYNVPQEVLSYAQQNNYLLIASKNNVYKFQFNLDANGYDFTPLIEAWSFSGGWYAPNGTQTKIVDGQSMLYGNFSINGASFSPYSVQEISNISTNYSAFNIYLGSYTQEALDNFFSVIPKGSIIYLQNIGCHFRVEGGFLNYKPFPNVVFDGVLNEGETIPATGKYCRIRDDQSNILDYYSDGILTATSVIQFKNDIRVIVANTASSTGFSMTHWRATATSKFTTWINSAETASLSTWIYGSLLTPVVDDTAHDYNANVEYGYISMTPNVSGIMRAPAFPHPTQLCFCEQRLWAGDWKTNIYTTESYSVVYGSQIARYNDFKNDYNQENEPVELDVLTQFKEKIVHLLDYNGLKIFTDSFEYAYSGGGVVKQSGNGSLAECDPIVFESLCLYCDKTGNQIRAMQYEFQSNIFNSSCINQVAPHDLINFPKTLACWEDKYNSTGKYLFVVNTKITESPVLSVCNFVPSNQANIWSRWLFPTVSVGSESKPLLWDVINMKDNPIFLINMNVASASGSVDYAAVVPAMLDFSDNGDCMGQIQTVGTTNSYAVFVETYDSNNSRLTLFNTEVAIYSDGVFQFTTTTNDRGVITEDLSGLTNITVGLPINSKIVSHPIDVGGKTKSVKKRIGKVQMSVHDTDAGAISINGKTGYMNPQKDHICFYGVSGMKDEVKYTITNKNGAMFHLESLLMNIEYGTLDS